MVIELSRLRSQVLDCTVASQSIIAITADPEDHKVGSIGPTDLAKAFNQRFEDEYGSRVSGGWKDIQVEDKDGNSYGSLYVVRQALTVWQNEKKAFEGRAGSST